MATTKKTSKATSKTAKKPVAKKATSAAKTTKATATKKVTASKKVAAEKTASAATAKKVVKNTDRKVTLRRLNWLSVLVGVAGAAAAGFLMNPTAYQFFTGLLTKNPLTGGLAPAVHVVWDIELRWIVVATLLISVIIPLLAATRNRKKYETALDNKVMLWRWVDTAVVGSLIVSTVALLSGVQDIMTLVLIGGFVVISSVLGYMSEKQNANADKSYRGAYTLGLVAALMPWLLIAVYALGTPVWGQTQNIWAVYALYFTTVICFGGVSLAQRAYIDRKANYEVTEQRYQLYMLLAKVAFVALLVLGFKK